MTIRVALLLGAAISLNACGRGEAEDAVAATLPDPQAARFQAVETHGDAVCGEVNGGGGYRRFVYRRGVASGAPATSYTATDLAGFDATCRMVGGHGNGLDRQVCTRAAEARHAVEQATALERLWQTSCE